MNNSTLLLVDSKILPNVFKGVILAKELLNSGRAQNASQAAKMAGISRSAFYKYKDYVFKYSDNANNTVTLFARIADKAGMLSVLTTSLYKYSANILTVNQSVPQNGVADVSITVKTNDLTLPVSEMLSHIKSMDGVISIKI